MSTDGCELCGSVQRTLWPPSGCPSLQEGPEGASIGLKYREGHLVPTQPSPAAQVLIRGNPEKLAAPQASPGVKAAPQSHRPELPAGTRWSENKGRKGQPCRQPGCPLTPENKTPNTPNGTVCTPHTHTHTAPRSRTDRHTRLLVHSVKETGKGRETAALK